MKKTTAMGVSLGLAMASAMVLQPANADEALATKGGCLTCHAVDKAVVGPGFKDIAAKYKGDAKAADTLAAKVKSGGSGVWGQMPMPPTTSLNDDEIKKVVAWILSM